MSLSFDTPPPEPPADDLEQAVLALPAVDLTADGPARVEAARRLLAEGRRDIEARHRAGASGRTVVRLHSALVDRLLVAAWETVWGEKGGACLVAIGGYGRSELAPHSDVDLLFLHEGGGREPSPQVVAAAEAVLYLLWDTGLEVGHSVRSVAECLAVAEEDHTARTALVDCRLITGDPELYFRFEHAMLGEVHSRRVEAFVGDKVEEWQARRGRFGETLFRLEPDVKRGEGGLRDLQTALWIARTCYHLAGVSDLGRRMLLPPGDVKALRAARDFIWRVRNGLHYRAGRREEHLTFDAQEALAEELGYRSTGHELAIEAFMRDYYLSARTVLRVSRQIIERCTLQRRAEPWAPPSARQIDGGFKVFQGHLTVGDRDLFRRDPVALIRIFEVADAEGLPIYTFARELVREAAAEIIDEGYREREDVAAAFRSLLTREGSRGAFFRDMHQTGVLGALIPEFGRQTGLWQHDLYHVYTADVHSLFALQHLLRLRSGELEDPAYGPRMRAFDNPYPLYLGTWFHDIGKGLGGGHSEKGAAMMPEVCRRLRLTGDEADEVRWLVEAHLKMSHTAQRRDLSDPELIASFAEEVGSRRRLDMLHLLTFADISTTGEGTWTRWKGMLLAELYDKTALALGEGEEPLPDPAAARARLEEALRPGREPRTVRAFLDSAPERYHVSVSPAEAGVHLSVVEAHRAGEALAARAIPHRAEGYTAVALAAGDRPGLLAGLTGVIAAHRLDIAGAQIFSLEGGVVVDVFQVRDPEGALRDAGPGWIALVEDLRAAAVDPEHGARLVAARRTGPRLEPRPEPPVEVKVRVDNDASADHTVVDVFARDRLGLLHTITRTLHELGLSVSLARVATEAHRATDAFYVTDAAGKKIEDAAALEELVARIAASIAAEDPRAPGPRAAAGR